MKGFYFYVGLVVAVLLCASCGIKLWVEYGLWAIACYAAIVLALPFSSFLHELGHMLAGAAVKIKAVPKFSLFGSSCVKLIPGTDKNLRPRAFVAAAGGLAVNLIIAVISLVPLYSGAFPAWLCVFLPSSAYLFFLNLSGEKTDGSVCANLIGNTDEAKVMLAVLTVQAQILNGKPVEEVDESLLFGVPQIREDDESFISLTELRYEYCKAKGDNGRAEMYASRLEELKKYL